MIQPHRSDEERASMHTFKDEHRVVPSLVTAVVLTNVFGSVFDRRANSVPSAGHVRKDCR